MPIRRIPLERHPFGEGIHQCQSKGFPGKGIPLGRSPWNLRKVCVFSVKVRCFSTEVCVFSVKVHSFSTEVCVFSVKVRCFSPEVCVFSVKVHSFSTEVCVFSVKVRCFSPEVCVFSVKVHSFSPAPKVPGTPPQRDAFGKYVLFLLK